MRLAKWLACFSGVSFVVYGLMCFYSKSMADDFHRVGLDDLRVLTGVLEFVGGFGLLVGLRWRPALWMSSAGLALLMLIAFAIRMKMRDGLGVSLPSFSLMLVNAWIFVESVKGPAVERVG